MHAVPRRIGAALIGALVVTALALTMTAGANAATTTVEIVTKATINGQTGPGARAEGPVHDHIDVEPDQQAQDVHQDGRRRRELRAVSLGQ